MPQKTDSDSIKTIKVNPRKSAIILEIIAICLGFISMLGQSLEHWTNFKNIFGLVPLFNIYLTLSIPTIYSVLLLTILMLLLAMITSKKYLEGDDYRYHWLALTIIAFYLSLNRGTHVHSLVIRPVFNAVKDLFQSLKITRLTLTVCLSFLVFLLFYRKFFFSLPGKSRRLLIISAIVYIIGFKNFGFPLNSLKEMENLNFDILVSVSKVLEMTGMTLLIYSFLDYVENVYSKIAITP